MIVRKPATAKLVEALATQDSDSVEGKNALDAMMDAYREDINGALRILKEAAARQLDALAAAGLEDAAQRARNQWCQYSYPEPCKE